MPAEHKLHNFNNAYLSIPTVPKIQVEKLIKALIAVGREHLLTTVTGALEREQHVEKLRMRENVTSSTARALMHFLCEVHCD